MAKSTFNSVPRGIGSGTAQVLGKSRALENLLDTIDYNQKMGLLNQQAQSRSQIATNKDFADNAIQAKGGILYQPEISSAMQKWVDTGAKYRAQGFNPFAPDPNDPKQVQASTDYLKDKQIIEGMAQTRDLYQKNFLEQQNAYEKGDVDEDSWVALNKFYKDNKLSDLHESGAMPPTLTKAFDAQGFLKGIAAPTIKSNSIKDGIETKVVSANEDAIRYNLENSLQQDPRAKNWLRKTYGLDETKSPLKNTIGTTDPAQLNSIIDNYYRSPKGVQEIARKFPKGEVPSYNSEAYNKIKNDAIQAQLEHENRYESAISSLTKQKAANVNTETEKSYNFALENQGYKREDQGMQRTRFGWAAENQANTRADRKDKKSQENLRDKNIQGVQVGDRESIQNLRGLAKAKGGNVSYTKNGKLVVEWNDGDGAAKTPRRQEIDLSEKKADGYAQINEVFNSLTGKKQDLETMQGKEPYKGGLVNVGERSLSKENIEFLRNKFTDPGELGEFFMKQKMFKSWKEAINAAGEVLDKKGDIHKGVVIKK